MKIKIRNFCNINTLDLTLDRNKLNFIYGISGSGKTSLSKAITTPPLSLQEYKTFGSSEDAFVEINNLEDFEIFNDDSIAEYIFAKSGEGIYDVIYGENKELIKFKQKLTDFLNSQVIIDVRNIISNFNQKIELLEDGLGLSRTGTGRLSNTGLIKTLSTGTQYYSNTVDLTIDQQNWIKLGSKFEYTEVCPFCDQSMTEEIVKRIITIANQVPEEFSKIIENSKILSQFDITVDKKLINKKEAQEELSNDIKKQYLLLNEMSAILDALKITITTDLGLDKKIQLKKPSKELIDIFSQHKIDIVSIVNQLKKDTEGYSQLKKQYNGRLKSMIKGNIRKINEDILRFDIDYKLTKSDLLNQLDTYTLVHRNASNDSSQYLSTGEKNIISMILFLTSNKDNNIIIDDPASSFDEYRRDKILKFLYDKRYTSSDSHLTTLILSHDQIFLKFLTKDLMNKDNIKIGKVFHLEKYNGEIKLKSIEENDMNQISNHIIDRLSVVQDYSQKIINLRLLYEIVNKDSIEYSYLSAILHSERNSLTIEKINELLAEKNISEEVLLSNIKTLTNVDLEKYNGHFKLKLENHYSNFEKICIAREFESMSATDKNELNNVVHFNYALNHLLNPYKFNFQSVKSYKIIDSLK